jgi:DNA-binding YbaB/EbfC family protein
VNDQPDEPDNADEPDNPFGGALPDLGGLLESAQQMMAEAQAAAEQVVEGVAGGGLVKITVDGHFTFHEVHIDPKAVDADDLSLLEDLVLAALRHAASQLQQGQQGALGGLDLGGLDLGGLGGMLGGGDDTP